MLESSASTYVVLKVYVTGQARAHVRELRIYKQMNEVETNYPGRNFIRKLLDHFDIEGPHGRHVCLVHEPHGTSADFLVKMFPGHAMTLDDMKPGIRQLLIALDFLHSEPNTVADLQLKNLLLPGPETSYLSRFEEAEVADPSPRKALKDRTIYKSLGFPPKGGLPILADFGEARLGDQEHNEDIMPNVYRAPEVILRSNWGYKVDIWSVAMVLSHSDQWQKPRWPSTARIPETETPQGRQRRVLAVAPDGLAVEPRGPTDGVGTPIRRVADEGARGMRRGTSK
ncbi:hypothetical protein AO1008_10663 [Aspergillus oryzae 100-8]|uniref:Protein kinase domain-containing protein n=1 Tax=Aspergillus oryzae (strain 3.042) TaxID=1160506 RepID=I8IPR5_ASPO3|nr:hypothetical protein Ao3042_02162 [Aspergillus oryzae 3.042]KDE84096.1 hypothetical protein AO1008_10663 [Aspergillus oryzae 100-8]|eukprot:EIT81326.1 hypothetical protein Ao3042_02162 [Aspergillus oryzae 3.042]